MANLSDYFETDLTHALTPIAETILDADDGGRYKIRLHCGLAYGAFYVSVYIPHQVDPLGKIRSMLGGNIVEAINNIPRELIIGFPIPYSPSLRTNDLVFCGRVFVYLENSLSRDDVDLIYKIGLDYNLHVMCRDRNWAQQRSETEKPLAFISHDSRDKDSFARPIAQELTKLGLPVWFDEYTLQVGDSLRESIERGIKDAPFCILILTKNFISNPGWTKVEFDSVFTKEIVLKQKCFIPIWCDVTEKDVFEYCPSLVDRVAAKFDLGVEAAAGDIKSKIDSLTGA